MNKLLSIITLFLSCLSLNLYSHAAVKTEYTADSTIKNIEITLYIIEGCIFSKKAVDLLKSKGLKYTTINVTNDPKLMDKLIKDTNQHTFPYIFIDKQFIGGFTELKALDDSKKL